MLSATCLVAAAARGTRRDDSSQPAFATVSIDSLSLTGDVSVWLPARTRAGAGLDAARTEALLTSESHHANVDATSIAHNSAIDQLALVHGWLGRILPSMCDPLGAAAAAAAASAAPVSGESAGPPTRGGFSLLALLGGGGGASPPASPSTPLPCGPLTAFQSPARRTALAMCGWSDLPSPALAAAVMADIARSQRSGGGGSGSVAAVSARVPVPLVHRCVAEGDVERGAAIALLHGFSGAAVQLLTAAAEELRRSHYVTEAGAASRSMRGGGGGGATPLQMHAELLQLTAMAIAGCPGPAATVPPPLPLHQTSTSIAAAPFETTGMAASTAATTAAAAALAAAAADVAEAQRDATRQVWVSSCRALIRRIDATRHPYLRMALTVLVEIATPVPAAEEAATSEDYYGVASAAGREAAVPSSSRSMRSSSSAAAAASASNAALVSAGAATAPPVGGGGGSTSHLNRVPSSVPFGRRFRSGTSASASGTGGGGVTVAASSSSVFAAPHKASASPMAPTTGPSGNGNSSGYAGTSPRASAAPSAASTPKLQHLLHAHLSAASPQLKATVHKLGTVALGRSPGSAAGVGGGGSGATPLFSPLIAGGAALETLPEMSLGAATLGGPGPHPQRPLSAAAAATGLTSPPPSPALAAAITGYNRQEYDMRGGAGVAQFSSPHTPSPLVVAGRRHPYGYGDHGGVGGGGEEAGLTDATAHYDNDDGEDDGEDRNDDYGEEGRGEDDEDVYLEITLHDRIAFACRFHGDNVLPEYLRLMVDACMQVGRVDAILLTGLSPLGSRLVQTYLDTDGGQADVQTAAVLGCHMIRAAQVGLAFKLCTALGRAEEAAAVAAEGEPGRHSHPYGSIMGSGGGGGGLGGGGSSSGGATRVGRHHPPPARLSAAGLQPRDVLRLLPDDERRMVLLSWRWIQAYRELLSRLRLWHQRAAFDVQRGKLFRLQFGRGSAPVLYRPDGGGGGGSGGGGGNGAPQYPPPPAWLAAATVAAPLVSAAVMARHAPATQFPTTVSSSSSNAASLAAPAGTFSASSALSSPVMGAANGTADNSPAMPPLSTAASPASAAPTALPPALPPVSLLAASLPPPTASTFADAEHSAFYALLSLATYAGGTIPQPSLEQSQPPPPAASSLALQAQLYAGMGGGKGGVGGTPPVISIPPVVGGEAAPPSSSAPPLPTGAPPSTSTAPSAPSGHDPRLLARSLAVGIMGLAPHLPQMELFCPSCNTSLTLGVLAEHTASGLEWLSKQRPTMLSCPACKKGLPRCALCLLPLGCLNPFMQLQHDMQARQEAAREAEAATKERRRRRSGGGSGGALPGEETLLGSLQLGGVGGGAGFNEGVREPGGDRDGRGGGGGISLSFSAVGQAASPAVGGTMTAMTGLGSRDSAATAATPVGAATPSFLSTTQLLRGSSAAAAPPALYVGRGTGSDGSGGPLTIHTQGSLRDSLSFAEFWSFCASCHHGGHASHLSEWFSSKQICPVAECMCQCVANDPGLLASARGGATSFTTNTGGAKGGGGEILQSRWGVPFQGGALVTTTATLSGGGRGAL